MIHSQLRTPKDRLQDLFWGILFVIWYVLLVSFPAFHFNHFPTNKSVLVATIVPPLFLLLVIVRFLQKTKK